MAITSVGFERAVTYAELGVLLQHAGAQYSVFGPDAFAVSAGTGDRVLDVQAGRAAGQGILDTSDAVEHLTAAPVASGNRWDLVVLRRDWGAKATTPVLIQGTAAQEIPAGRADLHRQGIRAAHLPHPEALVDHALGFEKHALGVDLAVVHPRLDGPRDRLQPGEGGEGHGHVTCPPAPA